MSETTNETKSNNYEIHSVAKVGDQLRDLRESKGYSLKYISQQTKISVRILENIEKSNFKELPNKTYVTGFLRSYCRILGTNADSYIDSYVNETDQNSSTKGRGHRKKQEASHDSGMNQKQVMAVLALVIIAGVFVGIFKFIGKVSDPSPNQAKENQSIKLETITASTPLVKEEGEESNLENKNEETLKKEMHSSIGDSSLNETKTPSQKEALEKASMEQANKIAAQKAAEEKAALEKAAKEKAEKLAAQKAAEEKEISFSSFQLPIYQFDTVDIDDISEDELPSTYRQSVIKGKNNVFINAVDGDTWITYKADDQKVKKFVLKQGRRILIRGEVIRLFMGNINVAKMFLNNRPLIVQSKTGVRSLVFPQEVSSNYKIPLFIYKKDGTVETSEEFINRKINSSTEID